MGQGRTSGAPGTPPRNGHGITVLPADRGRVPDARLLRRATVRNAESSDTPLSDAPLSDTPIRLSDTPPSDTPPSDTPPSQMDADR